MNWGNPRVDPERGRPWHVFNRPYSALTRLLPYLDQQPLHGAINFEVEAFPDQGAGSAFPYPQNLTAYGTTIATFLCPSDSSSTPTRHGCNYRGNYGVGPAMATTVETHDSGNGFYTFPDVLGPQSFPDGMAHTVAYGERIRGTGSGGGLAPARDLGNILVQPPCIYRDADYALGCCRLASTREFPYSRNAGFTWFYGDLECSAYNHAQEPNGRIPDAIVLGAFSGILTARSIHAAGVNSLMADGAVRGISNSISRQVWRSLGTRNGDELVE